MHQPYVWAAGLPLGIVRSSSLSLFLECERKKTATLIYEGIARSKLKFEGVK